eukprot:TRINITY_DN83197_c0_g1_i1.p1 TRINITY_DN83197_c0_g1~~TRINITY_DN83197_c0_g1_i1.p1  ORF type:complete len:445 (-),score=85.21 TRINITY_DN83197_c0_g1_i1:171-1505(-)
MDGVAGNGIVPATVLGAACSPAPARACHGNCGCLAAPLPSGEGGQGRPGGWCCKGCYSQGGTHDGSCLQLPTEFGDADVALAMQLRELQESGQAVDWSFGLAGDSQLQQMQDEEIALSLQRHEASAAAAQASGPQAERPRVTLWDPVWGELRSDGKGGPPTVSQILCFVCCPCFVVGCGQSGFTKAEVRRAWKNYLCSWAVFFSVVQTAMMIFIVTDAGEHVPDAENPFMGPDFLVFDTFGAKNAAKILYKHEWWRLVTPIFLHAGWLHLLGNFTIQLRSGVMLEVLFGHTRWCLIYVFSGIVATLASCVALPNTLSVGASGSICGILAAWAVFTGTTWHQTLPRDVPQRKNEAMYVVCGLGLIVLMSWTPLVDWAAHIGGMAAGLTLAMLLFGGQMESRPLQLLVQITGGLLTIALVAGLFWFLLEDTAPDKRMLHLCADGAC